MNRLAHVRESKTFLYSGFHAADSRYCIPVFDCGTWILDFNRYWDSGLLELLSGFHKQNFPGFQIPQAKNFPDSEIRNPLNWAKLLLSAPFLAETFWLNVVYCGQVRTHRRTCLWNKSPETKLQYLLSCLPICIAWVLWRFNSELLLDRSAKKERKKKIVIIKKYCSMMRLSWGGGGVRISRLVWISNPSLRVQCIGEEAMYHCICTFLCHCRSFNSSLCRLSPFQLSFVAVSWPCYLSASVFSARAFFTYHRWRWSKLTKLF